MDLPPEMLGVETPLVPGDVSLAAWQKKDGGEVWEIICWMKKQKESGKDSVLLVWKYLYLQ